MEIFELNQEQQKAFNDLKKAVAKCRKLNIGFFSVLENEFAYDKSMIADFGIDADYEVDCLTYNYPMNYLELGGCSAADDQNCHSFKLTPKGRKIFENEKRK